MVLTGLLAAAEELFEAMGMVGLFIVSFLNSSFLPLPADVILIPLALATPELALVYAAVTTIGSVMGAAFGYYVGYRGGRPVLKKTVSRKNIGRVDRYYERWGVLAVGVAGMSPVPYKVFTISSGAFKLDFRAFIVVSFLSRGFRFFTEAVLIMWYGEEIVSFLYGSFGLVMLGVAAAVIVLYIVWKQYW